MGYGEAAKRLRRLEAALYKLYLASKKNPKLKTTLREKKKDVESLIGKINDYLIYPRNKKDAEFEGAAKNVHRLGAALAQLDGYRDDEPKSDKLFDTSLKRIDKVTDTINSLSGVSPRKRVTKKSAKKKTARKKTTRGRSSRRRRTRR